MSSQGKGKHAQMGYNDDMQDKGAPMGNDDKKDKGAPMGDDDKKDKGAWSWSPATGWQKAGADHMEHEPQISLSESRKIMFQVLLHEAELYSLWCTQAEHEVCDPHNLKFAEPQLVT